MQEQQVTLMAKPNRVVSILIQFSVELPQKSTGRICRLYKKQERGEEKQSVFEEYSMLNVPTL